MTLGRHDPEELSAARERWGDFVESAHWPNQVAVLCEPLPERRPWTLTTLSTLFLRDAALRVMVMRGRAGRAPLLFPTDESSSEDLLAAAACLPSTGPSPEPDATGRASHPGHLLELLESRGFAARLQRQWTYCPSCDERRPWEAPGEHCEGCGAVLVERTTTGWNLRLEALADRIKPAFSSYHAAALYVVGGSPDDLFAQLIESGWPLTDPRSAPLTLGVDTAESSAEPIADEFAAACRLLETCAGTSPARFFVVRDPELEFTFQCLAAALESADEPFHYPPFQRALRPAAVHVDELLCEEHGLVWADGTGPDRPDTCPSCGRDLTRRQHLYRGHQLLEADSMLERWGPDVLRSVTLGVRNNVFDRLGPHGIHRNPVHVSEETFRDAERILNRLERQGKIVAERPDSVSAISARDLSVAEHELHHDVHRTIQTADEAVDDEMSLARVCAAVFDLAKTAAAAVDSCRPLLVRQAFETALRLLHPVAPVITETLWARLGHGESILAAGWPTFEPALARPYTVEVPIQVRKKVRARLLVRPGTPASELEGLALSHPEVQPFIAGQEVRRVIVVPDRIVNIDLEE